MFGTMHKMDVRKQHGRLFDKMCETKYMYEAGKHHRPIRDRTARGNVNKALLGAVGNNENKGHCLQ